MNKTILSAILSSIFFSLGLTLILGKTATLPITIEYVANVDHDMFFSCFYTTNPDEFFSEEKSVVTEVKSGGENKVSFTIPYPYIHSFRLDFGDTPHTIRISPISVNGETSNIYNSDKANIKNDIDQIDKEKNWNKISSKKTDPYIVFSNVCINAPYKTIFNWQYFFIVVLISSILFYYFFEYILSISRKIGTTDTIFIFSFLLILLFPLLKIDNKDVSNEENRKLAEKPIINKKEDLLTFGKNFEDWFNDHFGYRNIFINLHNIITENINSKNRKTYEQAFLGKNGWLFLKNTKGYSNNPIFTDIELQKITSFLETINTWCKSNNMNFYFVIGPDKNKIYGEHYKYVKKIRPDKEGVAYQLINYLNNNTNINCIYPADAIKEQKTDSIFLYYKNDTHWNYKGAYYAYLELMKQINKQENIPLAQICEWTEYEHIDGDLNRMCNGLKVDTDVKYLFPSFPQSNKTQTSIPHNIPKVEPYPHGIIRTKSSKNTNKCIVMGDSFSPLIHFFIGESFGESLRIQNGAYEFSIELQNLILSQNANYFVFVIVERLLPTLMIANFEKHNQNTQQVN